MINVLRRLIVIFVVFFCKKCKNNILFNRFLTFFLLKFKGKGVGTKKERLLTSFSFCFFFLFCLFCFLVCFGAVIHNNL